MARFGVILSQSLSYVLAVRLAVPWRAVRLTGAAILSAIALLVAGCGGATSITAHLTHSAGARHRSTPSGSRPAAVRLTYRPLYSLSAALRDPAYTALDGGRFAMLGGLDAADVSSAGIEIADAHRVLHTATLPEPQHDAQGAFLSGKVYVFGGGYTTELNHILSYDPASDAVAQVGALLAPQSDVAVARSGDDAYVVGGFDGTNYLNTIVAFHPGGAPTVVGHLPIGVRYAAVAVADGGLLIIGGSVPTGASDAVYRFDLSTHQVRRLATLRHPVTHGEAATLGSSVYLIGGRSDLLDGQTASVLAINPLTGRIRAAGALPQPTSDAAAVPVGDAIVIAGGQSPTTTLNGVGELVPVAAP